MIHLLSREQAFGLMTYPLKRVLGDSPRHRDNKALSRKFRGGRINWYGHVSGRHSWAGGSRSRERLIDGCQRCSAFHSRAVWMHFEVLRCSYVWSSHLLSFQMKFRSRYVAVLWAGCFFSQHGDRSCYNINWTQFTTIKQLLMHLKWVNFTQLKLSTLCGYYRTVKRIVIQTYIMKQKIYVRLISSQVCISKQSISFSKKLSQLPVSNSLRINTIGDLLTIVFCILSCYFIRRVFQL